MNDVTTPNSPTSLPRRDLFRLGGISVATASVLAACAYKGGESGRVGSAPEGVKPATGTVTDPVLLRTASSVQHLIVDVYNVALDGANVASWLPAHADTITAMRDAHLAHAETLQALTTAAGATAFTCANPKLQSLLVAPILDRLQNGVAETSSAKAIEPSDDIAADFLNLAHGLESMAAATCQAFAPKLADPALRQAMMTIGKVESRHTALLALLGNPGGYLAAGAAETTETNAGEAEPRPHPVALPASFGQLGAQLLVVGTPDENGVRFKINLETPSLNSMAYDGVACS